MTDGDAAAQRQAFRAWVRVHHPDAGGDPGEFAAGLARWRGRLAAPAFPASPDDGAPPTTVTVFRTHGLWRARRWWQRRHRPPRVF
jgi:hypothetical protein